MDSSNPPFTTLTPALEGCELAIISGALAHHQFLARQAYPGVQVVILGQPGAGLAAVTAALQQCRNRYGVCTWSPQGNRGSWSWATPPLPQKFG